VPEPFFLAAGDGQRFCLHHPPADGNARGAVVYVHPWAEEMNKSRRMAAIQARALAEAGYAVLQIDLHGCGDSSGDFGDATWAAWIDDVVRGARWMQERHDATLWLWGLRAGCLLAVASSAAMGPGCNFLFWQPTISGKLALQQFLRLKVVSDLQDGRGKAALEKARRDLAEGRAVEIAGYQVGPALAQGLEQAALEPPATPGRLIWLELATRQDATLLPASEQSLTTWRTKAEQTYAQVVAGPAFWQTTEIEEAPSLIGATLSALRRDAIA
jgi:exosortase A-associated hydrolase 2